MVLRRLAFGALAAWLALAAPRASAQTKLKVYISADMEGIAGVVTGEQLGPPGFEYERFRGFMTNEVLAAIEGARAAGATEILVSDSHGNGQNLLIERFPKDVQIVRAWPRPLAMMQGIDASFDAVLFVGFHSSTTFPEGVRAHTMSSANFADVRLNGVSVPEAGLDAAIAGHYGVPVAMISGDDAAVREAQALLGPIEGAVVKWNYGFHSARTLTPEASCDRIREAAKNALGRLSAMKPYALKTPVTLDVRFKSYRPSEVLAYLPIVERTDAHAIRFRGKDMLETIRFLEFLLHYEPGLTP
jgi:D-amino peptidase